MKKNKKNDSKQLNSYEEFENKYYPNLSKQKTATFHVSEYGNFMASNVLEKIKVILNK